MEGQNNCGGRYRDQASFWQFSDQLRLQTSGLSDLSIGDSIWSDCYVKQQSLPSTDLNGGGSSVGWKSAFGSQKLAFGTSNYGVNRYNNADSNRIGESGGVKSSSYFGGNYNDGGNGVIKDYFNTAVNKPINKLSASFGGTNIDPTAWEDKKCPGESRFPAQVRVVTRKLYEPLEEDSFRPILHHYDGPKFRLELNVEEALKLLDIFAEQNA
ncbi:hypothetical protein C4D60_Mb01t05840 [Musa balbisiana]|uniref:DCD domain-containing protein n=1 Tax=Musa balbisiana TaxID=52838 RepID=A0A4S8JM61_MUSBA|nr:hypothetical protein C4D60_Mb01t05840 [Musa balbisiana]